MWFYYALLSALLNAVNILARKTHGTTARPLELAWLTQVVMVPFSTVLLVLNRHNLYTSTDFLIPTLAASVIYAFAAVLMFTAYKYGEASEISPLQTLLPLGLIVTSYIMFKEIPSPAGLIGVLMVVWGVYFTSVNGKHRLLHPFKMIWRRRGSRAMLSVLVLWSVATNLQLISLRYASPGFLIFFGQVTTLILLSMYLAVQSDHKPSRVWRRWKWHIIAIGGLSVMSVYFQTVAMKLLDNSSYVLAVKGLAILIVIPLAAKFLHEKHAMRRFPGAVIAVVGVAVIYVFQ